MIGISLHVVCFDISFTTHVIASFFVHFSNLPPYSSFYPLGVLQARSDLVLKKTNNLDLSFVLDSMMCIPQEGENFCPPAFDRSWLKKGPYHNNGHTFCDTVLGDAEVMNVIERGAGSVRRGYRITNIDRSAFRYELTSHTQ